MDAHFTYANNLDRTSLKQGDLLEKTRELTDLIKEIHPHYANDEYTHFQILSQSCDLVRRGKSKSVAARYITIAAVRNLDTVVKRSLKKQSPKNKFIQEESRTLCSNKEKSRLVESIKSLLNNNDKSHFFLKAWPEKGLVEDSCTFLSLSIAIRSDEHYDKCLEAKILELDSTFQAKLGWLVGTLYSRVGTEDFVPACFTKDQEFTEYATQIADKNVIWIEHGAFADFMKLHTANSAESGIEEMENDAIKATVAKRQKRIENLVDLVCRTGKVESENKDKIRNLFNSSSVKSYLNF
jgi:hypothetical protein